MSASVQADSLTQLPVIHVSPMGNLANQMIQYMVAMKLANMIPNAVISNVELPDWGISYPPIESSGPTYEVRGLHRLDLPGLASRMRGGEYRRLFLSAYGQRMENFLEVGHYRKVFKASFASEIGFNHDYLVCPVRAGDIVHGGYPEYTLIPVEFYEHLRNETGLKLVFVGELSSNLYTVRLREKFQDALFLSHQSALIDFETVRRSKHIAVSVSTFSWLAAWLSDATKIYMPVSGLFNPMQYPEGLLLPFDDDRYRFYLFPINFAVLLEHHAALHRRLAPYWRLVPGKILERQLLEAPRFGRSVDMMLDLFDPEYYLAQYPGVGEVMGEKNFAGARFHYEQHGFYEARLPFRLDPYWYASSYPLAGFEVAQGDYEDFVHHYAAVGRLRGYKPHP